MTKALIHDLVVITATSDFQHVDFIVFESLNATERQRVHEHVVETSASFIDHGYVGLDTRVLLDELGNSTRQIFFLNDIPEGEVFEMVCIAASDGFLLPIEHALAAIEERYLQLGN